MHTNQGKTPVLFQTWNVLLIALEWHISTKCVQYPKTFCPHRFNLLLTPVHYSTDSTDISLFCPRFSSVFEILLIWIKYSVIDMQLAGVLCD